MAAGSPPDGRHVKMGLRAGDAGAAPGTSEGPLVLVVDDDPLNRTVMSAMLQKAGYQFHLATNGREAIEAVLRDSYSAVLMDCLMPEMDGYEATAVIRQHERESQGSCAQRRLPIIAVTAVAIQGARERCIKAGMDDYLSKPVVVQSVISLLDRWVASAGADVSWCPTLMPEPGASDDETIDRNALVALRQFDPEHGDALIVEMIADFATEVTPRLHSLHEAAARGDQPAMLQDLHFIGGCASIVGATRVERLARALEAGGGFDGLSGSGGAVALVVQLEEEVLRAWSALEAITASA